MFRNFGIFFGVLSSIEFLIENIATEWYRGQLKDIRGVYYEEFRKYLWKRL